ncbi:uncharacterized protein LOC124142668 [Haliotis rufescens]|uniref:uncharacterized protein LOC124142668 n=1 Tax=Haliotis rufescens TaxID=6454 RepID=UPI00201F6CCA|nr:uncharacterized protein LOC124142668 [Haliotis rufescens]
MSPSLCLQTQMWTIIAVTACLCAPSLTEQASDDGCVHPPVHEVVPGKDHDYIDSVGAPSMYDCAAECKLLPPCLSFTFDPEKRACQLLKKTTPSFTVRSGIFFSNIQDWKMPLTGACADASCGPNSQCTVGRYGQPLCVSYAAIGMNCTRDADCHVTMTLCFLGQCLCHPGYSHNIRRNSCDRECKRYGHTMTPYKELTTKGHNRKRIKVVGGLEDAMKMCVSACVEETSFVCKTVDFGRRHRLCLLSSEGYLDVTVRERERGQFGWWMAVRGCQ